MASLPDDVWTAALHAGVGAGVLCYRDLCSLSMASRSLNRLSSLACLWKPLVERDFPWSDNGYLATNQSACKEEYKARFERIKAAGLTAPMRFLYKLQSEFDALEKECKDLEVQIQAEKSKFANTCLETKRLEQARVSSVASRLWQPEKVSLMQQQGVEQQPVDPQFRQRSLEREAENCRKAIRTCNRCMDIVRQAIQKANDDWEFSMYNPSPILEENVHQNRPKKRQKVSKDLLEKQTSY